MKSNYDCSKIIEELKLELNKYGEDFKVYVLKKKRKVKLSFQETEINMEILEDYVLNEEDILEEEKKEYQIEQMSIAQALGAFMAQDIIL